MFMKLAELEQKKRQKDDDYLLPKAFYIYSDGLNLRTVKSIFLISI